MGKKPLASASATGSASDHKTKLTVEVHSPWEILTSHPLKHVTEVLPGKKVTLQSCVPKFGIQTSPSRN